MESTKAERPAEPKTKEELREAAKRARAEAARYEILADAQKGTASEPEETGRGEQEGEKEEVRYHRAGRRGSGKRNLRRTRNDGWEKARRI